MTVQCAVFSVQCIEEEASLNDNDDDDDYDSSENDDAFLARFDDDGNVPRDCTFPSCTEVQKRRAQFVD